VARTVDEVLVKMGIDPAGWTRGLATATTATNRFVSNLQANSKALAGLSLGGALSFAGMQRTIRDVTNEAAAQENAITKLTSNLRLDQRTRADSIGILTRQADAMQLVTEFSDEQVISAQATLAAFGQTDKAIEQLVPRVLDLAAGFKDVEGNSLDLDTVSKALGKALNGNSGALQKLGIDLNLAKGETLTLDKAIASIDQRFQGAAEAAGKTFSGQMKIATHQISEAKEAIGFALLPTILQLTRAVVPIVKRFAEWAAAHKDIVLLIVGGGIGGTGLIAALATLGLAIGALGGPITLAILGIGTLVGGLVALGLAQKQLPKNIEAVNAAIEEQQAKLQNLMDQVKKMPEPFSIFSLGSKKDDLRKEIAEITIQITKLKEARDKLTAGQQAPTGGGSSGGSGDGDAAKKLDKFIEGFQARVAQRAQQIKMDTQRTFEQMTANIELGQSELADAVIPQDQLDMIDERFQEMRDKDQETWAAITGSRSEFSKQQQRELDELIDHNAQKTADFAFAWGDMFAQVLESEKNFAVAFGKATVLALVKVLGAEARAAIAKILIEKAKELGKAAIGAPLSFGATLAAVGPIIAAAALAMGAISSVESKFAKSLGGFEQGGVIPRTSHFLMHEGEVVFNPKKNTTRELAASLERAGAPREAAMLRGGNGSTLEANLNFNGPLNMQLDLERAFDVMTRRLGRALGADTG
jgi:hypothetical protein